MFRMQVMVAIAYSIKVHRSIHPYDMAGLKFVIEPIIGVGSSWSYE